MDLIVMTDYAPYNDGYNYLFTIIDVFSKYAFVFPLYTKEASSIAEVLHTIFQYGLNPQLLLSDNGPEFVNNEVRSLLGSYRIHQLTTYPYTPLGIIERFNKTIKEKIFLYMRIHNTKRYIDALDDLVENYNHSVHSTIKAKPSYIHFCNVNQKECQLALQSVHQRLKDIDVKINAIPITPYQVGDAVRVVAYLDPELSRYDQFQLYKKYHKIKQSNWTTKIYFIHHVFHDGFIVKYQIKDIVVYPRKYYHHELQHIW